MSSSNSPPPPRVIKRRLLGQLISMLGYIGCWPMIAWCVLLAYVSVIVLLQGMPAGVAKIQAWLPDEKLPLYLNDDTPCSSTITET